MLEIKNLTKDYDEFRAVNELNLSVPAGEFFCFLGPNGAGKTTTIKTITGLLRPTSGAALIGGKDIQLEPLEAKKLIGYIPDQPYLYEKLSGRDFLHFVGDLFEVPRAQQDAALSHYFQIFALDRVADVLIENYSFGMRQKLCFAVAFMHRPKLLVVDEPMVGLDPRSARVVKTLLKDFCKGGGTVFLSTHLLAIAEELADRLGIITRGELRFLGTVAELRSSLAREGSLEDLFLELTADGVTDSSASPFLASEDGESIAAPV